MDEINALLGSKPTFCEKLAIKYHTENPATDLSRLIKIARRAEYEWANGQANEGVTLTDYVKARLETQQSQRGRKVPDVVRARIRAEHDAGTSLSQLADRYGIGETTVKRIINEAAAAPAEPIYINRFETEAPPCDEPMPVDESVDEPEPEPEKKSKSFCQILHDFSDTMSGIVSDMVGTFPVGDIDQEPDDDGPDFFTIMSDMRDFVEEHFGEHIPIDMCVDNLHESAQYHYSDPRTGKEYRIALYNTVGEGVTS